MGKNLIITGLIIAAIGVLWPVIGKFPLGRLPGDIIIRKENFNFYFPLASCILVSVIITIIFWLFKK
jgi:hypothetical protein